MTFGKARYNNRYEWELLRLCTNEKFKVVGGAERLFKRFIKDQKPRSIISYCDKAKFSGSVYSRLGMEHLYDSDPNKVWSKDDKYITNNFLNAHGYDQIFKTNYVLQMKI